MPEIWLATCRAHPTGGAEDGPPIDDAFRRLGIDARWAVWDDASVDWAAAPLVAVRSTWDYDDRHVQFLGWAERVDAVTTLVNPLSVLRWSTVKTYLIDLAEAGVPVVPTAVVTESFVAARPTIVKPAIGADGRGVTMVRPGERVGSTGDLRVAQPLVESVRTEGEHSVYVLGGEPVAAVRKRPASGDFRVHDEHGGRTERGELTEEATSVAVAALRAAGSLVGCTMTYARADMMRLDDGVLAISELELVEPGLYASVLPELPEMYASTMASLLRS